MSSLQQFDETSIGLEEIEKRSKRLENILRSKYYRCSKEIESWTFEIVFESDFLQVLSKCIPKVKISSNPSCHNPCLELLAMNLVKTNESSSEINSQKLLGIVDDEDIIEVFI